MVRLLLFFVFVFVEGSRRGGFVTALNGECMKRMVVLKFRLLVCDIRWVNCSACHNR